MGAGTEGGEEKGKEKGGEGGKGKARIQNRFLNFRLRRPVEKAALNNAINRQPISELFCFSLRLEFAIEDKIIPFVQLLENA